MYKIGEMVRYGTEGVCRIAEITVMKVGRERAEYFVLRPVAREGATVFVPVQNEALVAKMRPLLTKDEIDEMLSAVRREELLWPEDAGERKTAFQNILVSGNRRELLNMIRSLYITRERLRARGKRLRSAEEQCLRDAEKLLNDEFAAVLGVHRREVPEYIRSRIED